MAEREADALERIARDVHCMWVLLLVVLVIVPLVSAVIGGVGFFVLARAVGGGDEASVEREPLSVLVNNDALRLDLAQRHKTLRPCIEDVTEHYIATQDQADDVWWGAFDEFMEQR